MASISDPSNPLFQTIRSAAKRKIRSSSAGSAARLGQNIRLAGGTGVRTSGISLIPQLAASRQRSEAESSLEGRLAGQQLGQAGSLERLEKTAALNEAAASRSFGRQKDFAREQAKDRLKTALISGAFQIPGAFAGGFGKTFAKKFI